MALTKDDLIILNSDVSETIKYATHRLSYSYSSKDKDIWEQILRTNQNLQMLINDKISTFDFEAKS